MAEVELTVFQKKTLRRIKQLESNVYFELKNLWSGTEDDRSQWKANSPTSFGKKFKSICQSNPSIFTSYNFSLVLDLSKPVQGIYLVSFLGKDSVVKHGKIPGTGNRSQSNGDNHIWYRKN